MNAFKTFMPFQGDFRTYITALAFLRWTILVTSSIFNKRFTQSVTMIKQYWNIILVAYLYSSVIIWALLECHKVHGKICNKKVFALITCVRIFYLHPNYKLSKKNTFIYCEIAEVVSKLQLFLPKFNIYISSSFMHAISLPSHIPCFDHPGNILWIRIMKLLMQIFSIQHCCRILLIYIHLLSWDIKFHNYTK